MRMCMPSLAGFGLMFATLAAASLTALGRSGPPAEAGQREPPRTDRYGDPLPQGALTRLGTVRFCQPFPTTLAFSPDGKILASGGADNRIRLWDPDTGKEVRILEGHASHVNCIAISADGRWLASGGQDKDLLLWEVGTGKERRRFQGHSAPIERMALSPDGKVLASSCLAGTMRLWDTGTGKEIRSLPIDQRYRVQAMAFTPDSKHLAWSDRPDRGIQLVDVADGHLLRSFVGHRDRVNGLSFSADGATLISGGSDHTIRVWDVASGKERGRCGDEKMMVCCLSLAPDGKTLTYGTFDDGLVHVWDIAANTDLVAPWKAHQYGVVSIVYSPDSKKVAVARDTIAIHETATGKRLNPAPESHSRIQQIEYSADGKLVAVRRQDEETIEVWETTTWQKLTTIKAETGRVTSMVFSPGGKYLTIAQGNVNEERVQGTVCHWDPRTGKRQMESPREEGWLEGLSYSADGERLACIHMGQQRGFILWDPASARQRGRISDPDATGRLPRLSPDGRLLAGTTNKHKVALWDTTTGKFVRGFGKTTPGAWEFLAFSPDGKTIATGGSANPRDPFPWDIVLWETATGHERLRIAISEEGQVSQVAFSPDGRLLASVGRSETIRLWDAWTGNAAGQFTGHRGRVNSLSFTPDGRTLASGGADGTVLIWNVCGQSPSTKKPAEKLGRDELARRWDELAADPARAYETMAGLAWCPGQAEDLLKDRLAANFNKNSERLARLIADLDSDEFNVRDNAYKELAELGKLAEAALTKILEGASSVELRRRAQDLLARLEGSTETPERRRVLRAIEILERLATPDARGLLARLANEATEAEMAREARASLQRLGKRGKDPR
jgi:WD40 repeat protein